MILSAEYVSSGHPDRLCDSIVNSIVNYVVLKDKDALCGLECAVHTNKVFVDGRIAAGKDKPIINNDIIKEIIKDVYKKSKYGKNIEDERYSYHPFLEELEIILDICIEPLRDDERKIRIYSDDQNIVYGYALNSSETDYFPIEHYVAINLGKELNKEIMKRKEFGPDFKLLVQLNKNNNQITWNRLTLSMQHAYKTTFNEIYSIIKDIIVELLKTLFKDKLNSLSSIDDDKFYLNGAGDFIQGGPNGDNGLSGKKLCIDFYGPQVQIGGGAIYGKDPHKIDVCGPFRAREVALKLVKEHSFYSVLISLCWSPGETSPYIIEAYSIDEFGTKIKIDDSLLPAKDYFSIECINNDLNLKDRKIVSIEDIKI